MRRIKNWLYNRYLPAITKQMYLEDINTLTAANEALKGRIKTLEAYIEGLEYSMRRGSKITINNEVNNEPKN